MRLPSEKLCSFCRDKAVYETRLKAKKRAGIVFYHCEKDACRENAKKRQELYSKGDIGDFE